jgi:hypothetical protein
MSREAVHNNPVFGEHPETGGMARKGKKFNRGVGAKKGELRCGATAYPSITAQKGCASSCSLTSLEEGQLCTVLLILDSFVTPPSAIGTNDVGRGEARQHVV